MPQSLSCVHIHVVFSTKDRVPFIDDALREPLHRYTATVLTNLDCRHVIINSVEDHAHFLFLLSRKVAICDVVERVKIASSKWMKTQGDKYSEFFWQGGYGDFGVSA